MDPSVADKAIRKDYLLPIPTEEAVLKSDYKKLEEDFFPQAIKDANPRKYSEQ